MNRASDPVKDSLKMTEKSTRSENGRYTAASFCGRRKFIWQDRVLLALILAFAFFIRVYRVGDIPAGFFCDEASIGYNAFALGGWGIDENGKSFPLYINSFGGHKNPVYIYAAILPVRLLGPTEANVRLTSVVFGTLTVLGTFWLVYELWGIYAGLWAALFLSITPWNFHFSRIAFELISWPCMFVFGFAFLVRALRKGGWNWAGAGLMFGLTVHTYVMAVIFMPLFLICVFIIFLPNLIRQWVYVLPGVILFALIATPAVKFRMELKTTSHFKSNSWLNESKYTSLTAKAERFWSNYQRFYSYDFLFENGDRNARHSIANHGELYKTFLPLTLAGVFLICMVPGRLHFLILAWIFLFPVAAAFTNQLYATRSIIGSPLAPILSAFTITWIQDAVSRIRVRWLSAGVQVVVSVTIAFFFANEAMRYFTLYFNRYPIMSARGIYGFQYGYREMIEFMESRKDQYPQRILTATSVNQPQIFVNFYTRLDPTVWSKSHNNGYMIGKPEGYQRFNLSRPTLYALRDDEIHYFAEYEILHEVIDPSGKTNFLVVDVRSWKTFLNNWSLLGLFDYDRNQEFDTEYIEPFSEESSRRPGLKPNLKWTSRKNNSATLDLQTIFKHDHPKYPRNPERCCAEGATYLYFPEDTHAVLEVSGSRDKAMMWLNGRVVMDMTTLFESPRVLNVLFRTGWNELFLRSCETVGDWYVAVGIHDPDGKPILDLKNQPYPPGYRTGSGSGA
ncbi:glycosyltransferase family 39 protein [bacterium]|nr:glycosyltransferase family 39 protein [candidate division CSSED10-310 bacterium]